MNDQNLNYTTLWWSNLKQNLNLYPTRSCLKFSELPIDYRLKKKASKTFYISICIISNPLTLEHDSYDEAISSKESFKWLVEMQE